MRPNLRDVIELVRATGKKSVFFSVVGGIFSVSTDAGQVNVVIGSDIRKSVKRGLDALEVRTIESRKNARELAGPRGDNNSESNRPDYD